MFGRVTKHCMAQFRLHRVVRTGGFILYDIS